MSDTTPSTLGTVEPRPITEEMHESYLSYAMSVIVSRALPDARDGLKPVQRRILYAMRQLGLTAGAKHQKSAKVVGAVLGAYHPHGDAAVYDAMVRLAQEFSVRYPLVDGQGNYGSLDGDPAAAMRYTEARMSAVGESTLHDIEKDTVSFVPNYDGTQEEPTVLPARLPQLLLNGALGIAVGMATSIPPHNLGEVMDALVYCIDNPDASVGDVLQFVKGPDFPTGGIVFNQTDIQQAYATGRGAVVTRGTAEIVEHPRKKGRHQIVIREIPYLVNKATLLERIADLVREGTVEDVDDVRDESDRDGMRIAVDLKEGAFPKKVLNRLYKFTDLQRKFYLNMIALADGVQPKLLSLRAALGIYLDHRKEITTRRFRFELARAKERVHVLEGLAIALEHIDAVIRTIKTSADKDAAHAALRKIYKLSDRQATAILEMRLQTLAGLERKRVLDELKERREFIAAITAILASDAKIMAVVRKDLLEMKEKFSDERRTRVVKSPVGEIADEDLVPEEETIITVTQEGYIKRVDPASYRRQHRGGKGIIGIKTRQEDFVEHFFIASTHDDLLFFTESGRVHAVKAYEVPEALRVSRGKAIVNILELPSDEKVAAVYALQKGSAAVHLAMVTEGGMVKKTAVDQFASIRRSGLIAIALKTGDRLRWVQPTGGEDDMIIVSEKGQSIRFSERDVRPMGRATQGVRGIHLQKGDRVVGMTVVAGETSPAGAAGGEDLATLPGVGKATARALRRAGFETFAAIAAAAPEDLADVKGVGSSAAPRFIAEAKRRAASVPSAIPQHLLMVTRHGYGKRTTIADYRRQRRGGRGIKVAKVTGKTGPIVAVRLLDPSWTDLIVSSLKGQVIRMPLKNVAVQGRVTQGVRLIRLQAGDQVAAVAAV